MDENFEAPAQEADPVRLGFSPQPFALCRDSLDDEDDDPIVVAWGMTLPGGKAMAISPDRSMSLASSPESIAWLHGADLVWAIPT